MKYLGSQSDPKDIATIEDVYRKPSGGIPKTDLASAVQTSLGKADSAYQKPSTGIPSTDLASAVQTSLSKADTAYQKPSGGIPASDLADTDRLLPAGGTEGQVLMKQSGSDYDTKWGTMSVSPADIASATEDWLEENVTPTGSAVMVDSSLTISGAAADAKVTGGIKRVVGSPLYSGQSSNPYIHVLTGVSVVPGDKIYFKLIEGSSPSLFGYNGSSGSEIKGTLASEDIVTMNASYDELRVVFVNPSETAYNYSFMFSKLNNDTLSSSTYSLIVGQKENETAIESNASQISDLRDQISTIKAGSINGFDGFLDNLMVGRVYDGVYNSTLTSIKCTDYVPVDGGTKYLQYGGFLSDSHYLSCYDVNKQYISSLTLSKTIMTYPYDGDKNYAEFTTPSNAAFIRVNFFSDVNTTGFYLYSSKDLGNWAVSNVLVIGDSISADYYGSYNKWVTNLTNSFFFSGANMTNDSVHGTGFVATYQSDDDFVTRIKAKTAANYDSVIIFGGVNDYNQSTTFSTFTSAVDEFFSYLTTNFCHARICVLLPLMSQQGIYENHVGKKLKDYTEYIKTVCESYCLPVLNLTDESGFMPHIEAFRNRWTYLVSGSGDGMHPNEEWERRFLTPMIKSFLTSLM